MTPDPTIRRLIGVCMDLIGEHRIVGLSSCRMDATVGPSWNGTLKNYGVSWESIPGTRVVEGVVQMTDPDLFLRWLVKYRLIKKREVETYLALYTLRLTGEYPPYYGYRSQY